MRHGMAHRKLGRTSGHRLALFRNQLASLIESERIITTLPKAKELRPIAEKLITLARNDSVHARRQAARHVPNDALVAKLFDVIGPRFSERPGGYTRIMKLGARRGDAAEMAILELVERTEVKTDTKPAPAAAARTSKKKAAAPVEEPAATAEPEEKPKRAAKKAAPKGEGKAAPKKKAAAEAKPKKAVSKKKSEK